MFAGIHLTFMFSSPKFENIFIDTSPKHIIVSSSVGSKKQFLTPSKPCVSINFLYAN